MTYVAVGVTMLVFGKFLSVRVKVGEKVKSEEEGRRRGAGEGGGGRRRGGRE